MAIAYCCVLIAAVLPYVFVGYAKFAVKGYDNSKPREFLSKLEGKAKRAQYAQLNSFEAFPAFAAAVLTAQLAGVNTHVITVLALLFVILRIIYGICYVLDKALLRSTVWIAAFTCVLALFILAILRIS